MSKVVVRRVAAAVAIGALWLIAHGVKSQTLQAREKWPDAEQYIIVPPPAAAPLLAIGYNEVLADITWVRMLVYYGSARIGKSDLRYLDRLIENVIALDPYFERVYAWAGAATTYKSNRATSEEFEISARYLREGIERFPNNYDLYETLILRLWWDIPADTPEQRQENRVEAARLAEIAIRLPSAPPGAATRVATMWSDLGEVEHAKRTLKQMLLTTENKEARAKMLERFRELFADNREAELLEKAKFELDRQHKEQLPWAPSDLYILLGPRPTIVNDLDELADRSTVLGRLELLNETDRRPLEPDEIEDGENENGENEAGENEAGESPTNLTESPAASTKTVPSP